MKKYDTDINPRRLATKKRRAEVSRLKLKGLSAARIAEKLGVSRATITTDIRAIVDGLRKSELSDAADHRAIQTERLLEIYRKAMSFESRTKKDARAKSLSPSSNELAALEIARKVQLDLSRMWGCNIGENIPAGMRRPDLSQLSLEDLNRISSILSDEKEEE
jgi:transcriptional regulator with XRE-family HTH domain